MKIIQILFPLSCWSFNEDLKAVHYSIVSPGIDTEYDTATLRWDCQDCQAVRNGDSIEIKNQFYDPSLFVTSVELYLKSDQDVRVSLELTDFVANLLDDSSQGDVANE